MEPMELYRYLLLGGAFVLGVFICVCLVRAILGPRFTDRVVAANIISTKTIILIAILTVLRGEAFLLDIAIVYAMISFLAVVVLSKCYHIPSQPRAIDPDAEAASIRRKEESLR